MTTKQEQAWATDFGKAYTDRSIHTPEQMDNLYVRLHGITRTKLNYLFLAGLPRSSRILEVGCNVGNQLLSLAQMGFWNLWGIDIQPYALELGRKREPHINFCEGSALDIPFKDEWFDLVMTNGLLIHIPPEHIQVALEEIDRVSNRLVMGKEYYSEEYVEVKYREQSDLLWKADFSTMFLSKVSFTYFVIRPFPWYKLVRSKMLPYVEDDNVDHMYLLEK